MKNVHQQTIRSLSESMVDLGLVPLGVEETISMMHFFEFFMHGTGHWLGLDVHDAGSIEENNKPRKLMPGMVTTVEPGIYNSSTSNVKDQWKGIGIRIEDNILVTAKGNQNLTDIVPSNPNEIEALMA